MYKRLLLYFTLLFIIEYVRCDSVGFTGTFAWDSNPEYNPGPTTPTIIAGNPLFCSLAFTQDRSGAGGCYVERSGASWTYRVGTADASSSCGYSCLFGNGPVAGVQFSIVEAIPVGGIQTTTIAGADDALICGLTTFDDNGGSGCFVGIQATGNVRQWRMNGSPSNCKFMCLVATNAKFDGNEFSTYNNNFGAAFNQPSSGPGGLIVPPRILSGSDWTFCTLNKVDVLESTSYSNFCGIVKWTGSDNKWRGWTDASGYSQCNFICVDFDNTPQLITPNPTPAPTNPPTKQPTPPLTASPTKLPTSPPTRAPTTTVQVSTTTLASTTTAAESTTSTAAATTSTKMPTPAPIVVVETSAAAMVTEGGLSGGTLAAIIVGLVVLLLSVCSLVLFIVYRRRRRRTAPRRRSSSRHHGGGGSRRSSGVGMTSVRRASSRNFSQRMRANAPGNVSQQGIPNVARSPYVDAPSVPRLRAYQDSPTTQRTSDAYESTNFAREGVTGTYASTQMNSGASTEPMLYADMVLAAPRNEYGEVQLSSPYAAPYASFSANSSDASGNVYSAAAAERAGNVYVRAKQGGAGAAAADNVYSAAQAGGANVYAPPGPQNLYSPAQKGGVGAYADLRQTGGGANVYSPAQQRAANFYSPAQGPYMSASSALMK